MNKFSGYENILRYGKILHDKKGETIDKTFRGRLVRFNDCLYYHQMVNGEVEGINRFIRFGYEDLDVVIEFKNHYIRINEKIIPIVYTQKDFIWSITKTQIKTNDFERLVKTILENKKILHVMLRGEK